MLKAQLQAIEFVDTGLESGGAAGGIEDGFSRSDRRVDPLGEEPDIGRAALHDAVRNELPAQAGERGSQPAQGKIGDGGAGHVARVCGDAPGFVGQHFPVPGHQDRASCRPAIRHE